MRVDVHSHFAPTSYITALRRKNNIYGAGVEASPTGGERVVLANGRSYPLLEQLVEPEAKIAEMDQMGFDVSVLSPPLPAMHHELENMREIESHVRTLNDGMAAVQETEPTRLRCMAALPMQNPRAATRELARVADELGLSAVAICANINGRNLDEPEFREVFQHIAERGVLLFVHALLTNGTDRLKRHRLFNAIGNPLDAAIAVASLIYGRILEDYPGISICVAHGGGAAPFIIGRIDRAYDVHPELTRSLPHRPSTYASRLYYDSITHDDTALEFLIRRVGASQVMAGSDCPFHIVDMGDPRPIERILALELADSEKELILGGNAARLLR